ncbi:glycosyltransferase [Pseudarthrobacter sp. NPDC058362]|uniref:glycosyltransferase n=1 Tax=Pseudarthrobacter sp. NPDC058362 TaxID=3346458 RepID=UPI0036687DF3
MAGKFAGYLGPLHSGPSTDPGGMMNELTPPLKVLVAHPSADLYGSDRVLLETLNGLVRAGANVVVTMPSKGPLVTEIQSRGAAVILCPTPVLRKSLLSPKGLAKIPAAATHGLLRSIGVMRGVRPDVVLANTITVPVWTVAGRLCRVPVVTHVHESEASAPGAVRAALALPLVFSTAVLTNSRFSTETLERSLRILRGRSTVLNNGVPGPPSDRPPRASLTGGLRILYVGRLSRRKGVDVAVEALLQLLAQGIPAQLSIVGAAFPGNEVYEEGLHDKVRAAGVSRNVTFHGFQHDVWPFLAGSDVVVVPSRLDEPFGNTAVEAILASRPVVVSDTSGLREAADGYLSAQFVAPGNPTELAAALISVSKDWPRFRAAATADAARAASRHSPERFGALMACHVAQAAGRPV